MWVLAEKVPQSTDDSTIYGPTLAWQHQRLKLDSGWAGEPPNCRLLQVESVFSISYAGVPVSPVHRGFFGGSLYTCLIPMGFKVAGLAGGDLPRQPGCPNFSEVDFSNSPLIQIPLSGWYPNSQSPLPCGWVTIWLQFGVPFLGYNLFFDLPPPSIRCACEL